MNCSVDNLLFVNLFQLFSYICVCVYVTKLEGIPIKYHIFSRNPHKFFMLCKYEVLYFIETPKQS